MDPADALGPNLLCVILFKLPEKDLACCTAVSKEWREQAGHDFLWARHLSLLTHGKQSPAGPTSASCPSRLDAYKRTLRDSQRVEIGVPDLTECVWEFRVKRVGIAQNPYWQARPPMERHFRKNGTISNPLPDSSLGEQRRTWRFINRKEGRRGHFVRVNQWPALEVSRRSDWGWRMENQWVVYESTMRKLSEQVEAEGGGDEEVGVGMAGGGAWLRVGDYAFLFEDEGGDDDFDPFGFGDPYYFVANVQAGL